MKSLLVAIAFTLFCYIDFADSQTGDEKFHTGYAPSGPYPPRKPGGYNNQYHPPDERAASGTIGNFGSDEIRNGGLTAGSVNLQNNKGMNVNLPPRFMPGNAPGNSRAPAGGRQFDGGSAWRPVDNGGTPIRNIHGPAGQGPNIGGWNSGANVLPVINGNAARGERGFNNIPNIHQGAQGNVGTLFSDLNKGDGKLNDVIKNLMSRLIQKENAGGPLKSGSFADPGKARNGFNAKVDTSDPGGIQRNNNAGVPNGNFAPLGNVVRLPITNGQPAVRPPNSASNVGQTPIRPENIPVASGLPHQVNNVPNGLVDNKGARVINTPGIVQNYDSRSGLSNSNINGNAWNGPFGIVPKPFVGGQTVDKLRPGGISPFAQLPAVRPRGIPPPFQQPAVRPRGIPPPFQQPAVRPVGIPPLAPLPAIQPGDISTGGGLLHSTGQGNPRIIDGTRLPLTSGQPGIFHPHSLPNIVNGNNKVPLGTINSPATTQKQTIVYPEKSVLNASPTGINESTNQKTANGSSGTDISDTSGLPKKDSIGDNGSGGLDNSSQSVGSDTENGKDASVVGSNNGGDKSVPTESQAINDKIDNKGQKKKGKKRKSKKRKNRRKKSKKTKTVSNRKSAVDVNSDMEMDNFRMNEEIILSIIDEGGKAAKPKKSIHECFDE